MKKLISRPAKLPPKKSPVKTTNIVDHVANAIKSLTLPAPTPIIPAKQPGASSASPAPSSDRFTPMPMSHPGMPMAPEKPFDNGTKTRRNYPEANNVLPIPPKQTGEAGKNKASQTHIHVHLNG